MDTPDTFRAGDSITWTELLPEYQPSDGWSLKFRLLWSTGNAHFDGAPAGDHYTVSLSSAETGTWSAGPATLVCWVEHSGAKKTLSSKPVTILPDLTSAAQHDGRSRNRRALDDAEAALAAYLAGGKGMVAEYEIAGRKLKFRDAAQIVELINYYRPLVARENAAMALLSGGSTPGRIYYRG